MAVLNLAIFCMDIQIYMPGIMKIALLPSLNRHFLIFILPATSCFTLIYLFATIYFHKMVPMVTLFSYRFICLILPIITLIFVIPTFKFSFYVSHSTYLSTGFCPKSIHFLNEFTLHEFPWGLNSSIFPKEKNVLLAAEMHASS